MAGLAAIQYAPEAFDTRVGKLMGRQIAGETFLKAWIEHSGADPLTGFLHSREDGQAFVAHARELGYEGPIAEAAMGLFDPLISAGAMWLADPSIATYAWTRRWVQQAAWSIVGITHTMSTRGSMDRITALLTAPVQPWDALICTSRAVKAAVERTLEAQADYLVARVGASGFTFPQLPVIPLGVACDTLATNPADRARWRAELGLGQWDVAILQFGRLSFQGKAHPLPLYLALEQAAKRGGPPLHLIKAGQFSHPAVEAAYRDLAGRFAKSVTTHFVDGARADAGSVRSAADIGVLLSDNIQESFGLAPVELMAAGLPVVASDWDGFRDTIEHGVTGFRIDTLLIPADCGYELVRPYALEIDSSDAYHAAVSQSTAIDIGQAADAFAALASDPERRQTMGVAARQRARTLFDWPVVIGSYVALLADLGDRRCAGAGESAAPAATVAVHPGRLDPFDNFAAHATQVLAPEVRLAGTSATPSSFGDFLAAMSLVPGALPPVSTLDAICVAVMEGPLTIAEIATAIPPTSRAKLYRGIGWLLKFGFLSRG